VFRSKDKRKAALWPTVFTHFTGESVEVSIL
jgi:hypothetical protein